MLKLRKYGKFLLIDRLSTGGMAEVYLARPLHESALRELVAIKRILPTVSEDPEFQSMFLDEARITSGLVHPNIGEVIEFGKEESQYYLAMKYIAGKDLRAIQVHLEKTDRVMPVDIALFIGARICEALDHAHRLKDQSARSAPLNIVHRDVSPPNVVVSYDGVVRLIDFGIAKAASRATQTRAGKLKGKFAYMSPEQVEGRDVDRQSDVFSMGALLHELLTNRRLFVGETQLEIMSAVRQAQVPPPSAVNPNIPLEVDRIVLTALERDRDKRYGWASEFRADIERYFARAAMTFDAADLLRWMHDEFAGDVEAERLRLDRLGEIADQALRNHAGPAQSDCNAETLINADLRPHAVASGRQLTPAAKSDIRPKPRTGRHTPVESPATSSAAGEAVSQGQLGSVLDAKLRAPFGSTVPGKKSALAAREPNATVDVASDDDPHDDDASDAWSTHDDRRETAPPPRKTGASPVVSGPGQPKHLGALSDYPTELHGSREHGPLPAPDVVASAAAKATPQPPADLASEPTRIEQRPKGSPAQSLASLAHLGPWRQGAPPAETASDEEFVALGETNDDTERKPWEQRPATPGAVIATTKVGLVSRFKESLATLQQNPSVGPYLPRFNRLQAWILLCSFGLFVLSVTTLIILAATRSNATHAAPNVDAQSGSLVISTSPAAGCTVTLDQGVLGALSADRSFSKGAVPAGTHQLELDCAGFRPFRTIVTVHAGRISHVPAELERR